MSGIMSKVDTLRQAFMSDLAVHVWAVETQDAGMAAERPNRIEEWRKRRNEMSMARLAELAETSASQINKLEKGERRLTVEWLDRLSRALKVRPSDLLLTNGEPSATGIPAPPHSDTAASGPSGSEIGGGNHAPRSEGEVPGSEAIARAIERLRNDIMLEIGGLKARVERIEADGDKPNGGGRQRNPRPTRRT